MSSSDSNSTAVPVDQGYDDIYIQTGKFEGSDTPAFRPSTITARVGDHVEWQWPITETYTIVQAKSAEEPCTRLPEGLYAEPLPWPIDGSDPNIPIPDGTGYAWAVPANATESTVYIYAEGHCEQGMRGQIIVHGVADVVTAAPAAKARRSIHSRAEQGYEDIYIQTGKLDGSDTPAFRPPTITARVGDHVEWQWPITETYTIVQAKSAEEPCTRLPDGLYAEPLPWPIDGSDPNIPIPDGTGYAWAVPANATESTVYIYAEGHCEQGMRGQIIVHGVADVDTAAPVARASSIVRSRAEQGYNDIYIQVGKFEGSDAPAFRPSTITPRVGDRVEWQWPATETYTIVQAKSAEEPCTRLPGGLYTEPFPSWPVNGSDPNIPTPDTTGYAWYIPANASESTLYFYAEGHCEQGMRNQFIVHGFADVITTVPASRALSFAQSTAVPLARRYDDIYIQTGKLDGSDTPAFRPSTITARVGDHVEWQWPVTETYTIVQAKSAEEPCTRLPDGLYAEPLPWPIDGSDPNIPIPDGTGYAWAVPANASESTVYIYAEGHCEQGMRGQIIVHGVADVVTAAPAARAPPSIRSRAVPLEQKQGCNNIYTQAANVGVTLAALLILGVLFQFYRTIRAKKAQELKTRVGGMVSGVQVVAHDGGVIEKYSDRDSPAWAV